MNRLTLNDRSHQTWMHHSQCWVGRCTWHGRDAFRESRSPICLTETEFMESIQWSKQIQWDHTHSLALVSESIHDTCCHTQPPHCPFRHLSASKKTTTPLLVIVLAIKFYSNCTRLEYGLVGFQATKEYGRISVAIRHQRTHCWIDSWRYACRFDSFPYATYARIDPRVARWTWTTCELATEAQAKERNKLKASSITIYYIVTTSSNNWPQTTAEYQQHVRSNHGRTVAIACMCIVGTEWASIVMKVFHHGK